jgi:predicted RNA-binding Zn ribbon-like protein
MAEPAEPLAEDRDGFRFRGGHNALDLTATLAARIRGEPRELLARPADLDRWLISSGLAGEAPHATQDDVETARELREAIYALVSGRPSSAALTALNAVAALRPARPQLSASSQLRMTGIAREYLATIAGSAIELLGSAERDRVRQCDGEGCSILFLDLSRSGGRRWCSMSGCGNRAKARTFRKRRHED